METPDTATIGGAPLAAPPVAAVVVARRPGDLSDVLGAVGAQVYDPTALFVVARDPIGLGATPVQRVATMSEVLAQLEGRIDYIWVVDQDARPRPDALQALVGAAEQVDAGVAGSKLLRHGAPDELVSVGAATDVFGVPYTGLDLGEVDHEQYDVVRDVAFVEPASMLIRRDLFAGLGGLDGHLPFEASGIDLCQRARLAGGRVVVVPSAEALLLGASPGRSKTWREQAGRLRAMLKSYSALTLVWALPALLVVGLISAVHDMFRGRPLALLDLTKAWLWNGLHLSSTLRGRYRARRARQAGDDELFLYQVGGSVELRTMAAGLSDRLANPDEEADIFETDVVQLPGFWQQPAFIAGVAAIFYVVFVTRAVWSDGLPVAGFSLPLRPSALAALTNYAGGWVPAELGSPTAFHPSVGASALVQLALFSRAALASTVITVGAVALGITGTARLLRPFGVGPYARQFAGFVLMTGPTAAFAAGEGDWPALVATGVAPWAVAVVLTAPAGGLRSVGWFARAALLTGLMGAYAPIAVGLPLLAALLAGPTLRAWRRIIPAVAIVAVAAALQAPWILVTDPEDLFLAGAPLYFDPAWWTAAWMGLAIVVGLLLSAPPRARLAAWAALLAGVGLFLGRAGTLGIGRETSVAGMVAASLGMAVLAGVTLTVERPDEAAGAVRRMLGRLGPVVGFGLVVLAMVPVPGGRAGLPTDAFSDPLAFATSRAHRHGSDRVLLVGPSDALPGEVRRLADGTAYRVVGGPVPHLDEAWPAAPRLGDQALASLLEDVAAGGELRPGERLAEFGIRWVVFTGPTVFEQTIGTQLDLRPLPDLDYPVFENDVASPRAVTDQGAAWSWVVPGYEGSPRGNTVRIAENADPRWGDGSWEQDGWANRVGVGAGSVEFGGVAGHRAMALAAGGLAVALAGLGVIGAVSAPAARSGGASEAAST